jgi:hypothetical protein
MDTHYTQNRRNKFFIIALMLLTGFLFLIPYTTATNFYTDYFDATGYYTDGGNTGSCEGIYFNVNEDTYLINITQFNGVIQTAITLYADNVLYKTISTNNEDFYSVDYAFLEIGVTYKLCHESTPNNRVVKSYNSNTNHTIMYLIGRVDGGNLLTDNNIHNFYEFGFTDTLCIENWISENNSCINGLELISYIDLNSCGSYDNLPALNGSSKVCPLIVNITGLDYDNKFDFSNNFLIHIFFWIIIYIILYFAFYSTGYFKFLYSIGAIVLYGYIKYLEYTLFSDLTGIIGYAEYWLNGALYIIFLCLLFLGIWALFNPKNR